MNLNAAAIVCGHIAMKQHPILRAERGPSLSPEDSGWQFLCCAVVQENEDEANPLGAQAVGNWRRLP